MATFEEKTISLSLPGQKTAENPIQSLEKRNPHLTDISREKSPLQRSRDILQKLEYRLRLQKKHTLPDGCNAPITLEYAENCQMYDFIICLSDLLSSASPVQQETAISYLTGGILDAYEAALQNDVIRYTDIF